MAKEKKEKKPLPKALRIAGYAANIGLWNNGIAYAPGAIKKAVENEKQIAAKEAAK